MYEADKPLLKNKEKTFPTEYEKINHMQQVIDGLTIELQNLRRELDLCHEKIMKRSQK